MSRTKDEHTQLLLTSDEAARILSVSRRQLRRYRVDGLLCPIKIGKRAVRYKLCELRRFVEQQQSTSSS